MMLVGVFSLGVYLVLMTYTSREVYEHISTQTNDSILEWKTCRVSGQKFPIYQTDLDFYNKISPTFETTQEIGDKLIAKFPNHYSRTDDNKLRVQVPTPTLCPEERQRRRLMFRNERKLYKRKCDFTGKDIISIYSPDKPYKVYDQSVRWSDEWDMMSYGLSLSRDVGFSSLMMKILLSMPTMSLYVTPDATENNCIYVNAAGRNKDCYYIFDSDQNENCMFSNVLKDSQNSLECSGSMKCVQSYELIYSVLCTHCQYCMFCTYCENCIGCRSCISCKDCYGCYGLVQKQYCIFNKQYTKEEYEDKIVSLFPGSYNVHPHDVVFPSTHNELKSCEGYAGTSLVQCKNAYFCFDCVGLQDSKYCEGIMNGSADVYDYSSFGELSSLCLECEGSGRNISNVIGGRNIFSDAHDIFYSRTCSHNSSYLFGCVGLRNKQYCIFNKQYTKEQRHSIVPQLIARMIHDGEWGEFFDPSLSPFGYNETVAQEYFPLTKEEALARGYKRSDYSSDPVIPANAQVLRPGEISVEARTKRRDDDTILRQVILCEASERPFMIQKMELDFYRKHNLPLPRKHPDVRHEERMKLRPGRTLYLRTCDKCGEEMLSVYVKDSSTSSEGQQKVYCEKCYQQEVFG